jgi:two-component SAPR family response regulator
MKILLLDDEKDICLIGKEMLEDLPKRDYSVTIINNPYEALDLLKTKDFDAIVTDINFKIPEMNGMDFALKVREFNKVVPIVFITAWEWKGLSKVMTAIGNCNIVLFKPHIYQELDGYLMEILKESKKREPTFRIQR